MWRGETQQRGEGRIALAFVSRAFPCFLSLSLQVLPKTLTWHLTPENGFDACEEFASIKGFGDIVICTRF